jgi:hypothetical protein
MRDYNIPKLLNGEQLQQELQNANIKSDIPVIADEKLWLNTNATDQELVAQIVKDHVGILND